MVDRYKFTFEVSDVAAYNKEDADRLAAMYLDRIKGLAPNNVILKSVECEVVNDE
jgi:hypothetical protein